MATVKKVSVLLSREDAAWARATAKRRRVSVSSVVSSALERQRKLEARERLLDGLGREAISEGEGAALRREIRGVE
jgi:hypothetical protein